MIGAMRFGLRNLARNKLRLGITVVLITFPFFLLLVMQTIGSAVQTQTELLKRQVDTSLQLRARGSLGHVNMVGSSQILPEVTLEKVQHVQHVVKVEPYLLAMMPTEGTNFAMNVGFNPGDTKRLESHGEAGNPRILAGRDVNRADRGKDVAVIGQGYALWAGITPQHLDGAVVTIDPRRTNPGVIFPVNRPKYRLHVVGIFASGYTFGDMQLFTSLDTFRRIYGVPSGISWLFTTVDSVDHLSSVEQSLRNAVGDVADIIAPKSAANFESSTTQSVVRLARAGEYLAGGLMIIVIFFAMLLLVRERAREIGTLKALGASNGSIIVAFLTEAVALTLVGGLLATLSLRAWGGQIAQQLFSLGMAPFLPPQYKDSLAASLPLSSDIGVTTAGLIIAISLLVAIAGSAYSVRQIVRLSPLEAIRHE